MTRPDLHLPRSRPPRPAGGRATRLPTSGLCALCGTYRRTLHRDHIEPLWKGGPDTPENVQLICANCHEDKNRIDMLGYRHAPETLARMAAAQLGRRHSAETKAKIAAALTGRRLSPLTKWRMSQGHLQSRAAQARWAGRK